ncbi:GGDEF domain-containing protein [Ancylobacter amanitiformis]|uniref:diguanylate cyclase n=1 Tax=Ancylobacter amanitiformis TaxID=217069 RepID=A0ABU0LL50_9HYPH|nr:GGDEF domain-containing protein [Ancylobacter amanitiformis]MDQ0509385.1 diguanylate cyclase (GGDEF)-like protein [Ancylobacter amanitiformis]
MAAATMLAAAMLFVWWLTPSEPALAHWAAAIELLVIGILCVALRGVIPDALSIALGNGAMLAGYGLFWTGLRRFDGRPPRTQRALIAPFLFVALCQLPFFAESTAHRVVLISLMIDGLNLLAIAQLRRGRLVSQPRLALLTLLAVVLVFNLARIPTVTAQVDRHDRVALFSDPAMAGFGLLALAMMIFICFAMVLMVRERREMHYRSAAQRDELTGLLNRRGFMESAMGECVAGGAMAVMLLDLDHFKLVNDRFGHGAGDRVLSIFARVLRENLRHGDIIGRIGGEEFAAVLPGALLSDARLAAERVQHGLREAVASMRFGDAGEAIQCTVSIGLAVADLPKSEPSASHGMRLQALIAEADTVLYRAKSQGRNRIEIAPAGPVVLDA